MDNIITKDLVCGYQSPLIEVGDIQIQKGKIISLIGKNGVGKSTFLKTLSGMMPAWSGDISYDSKIIHSLKLQEIVLETCFIPSKVVFPPMMKVDDVLHQAFFNRKKNLNFSERTDRINMIKEKLSIKEFSTQYIGELSDGQRQKVIITNALCRDTSFVLLDEPFAFLDAAYSHEMLFTLQKLAEETHKTILFSCHDLMLSFQFSDEIILIHGGKLHHDKNDKIRTSQVLKDAFSSEKMNFDPLNFSFTKS